MKVYYAYNTLKGLDSNCAKYIENADKFTNVAVVNEKIDSKENISLSLE